MLLALVSLAGTAAVLAACGGTDEAGADGRLKIVTTVSPITNIAANVAGGLVDIAGVVPEGVSSHEFEPAPSVAKTLADADIVFVNGLGLEEPTIALAEANLGDGAEIVELAPATITREEWIFDFSFPEAGGDPNPHLWTNPLHAKRYAQVIRDTLAARDPEHADSYRANYERFAAQIDAFDAALRQATETVPRESRKLLTYHDSFPYFAREYDWTVVGAIQPSDFSEPSARDVAELIRQIESEQVPAIFGSEVFPSPVLEKIAGEAGARYVDDLRDDDLPGQPGDAEHSLLGLLRFDYTTIVSALGGDPAPLQTLETGNLAVDDAEYPQ
jgi:ABC-type Zn uptake system ZnuABC Zn-binding protein ZnuA